MQKPPPTGEPAADPSSTHDDDNDSSSSSGWEDPEERAPPHKRVLGPETRSTFNSFQIDSDTPVSSAECSHSAFASAASWLSSELECVRNAPSRVSS